MYNKECTYTFKAMRTVYAHSSICIYLFTVSVEITWIHDDA